MTPGAPPALSVDGVGKRYRRQPVLTDLSLAVSPDEVFGLVGLNGAGKTTLVRIILGLARADRGKASLFGLSSRRARARRAVSFLPERFMPSPQLTGWEFLSLTVGYYRQRLDREAARTLCARLTLPPERLRQRVGAYSKGMAQKLGLVGCLLPATPLLILDEPMSGLDPEARAALKGVLMERGRGGGAVFFSTHMLADVEEICDRMGVLHQGRLMFDGSVSSFRARHPAPSLETAFLTAIDRLPSAPAPRPAAASAPPAASA